MPTNFSAPLPPRRATGDPAPAADVNLLSTAVTEVRAAVNSTAQFDNTGATDCTAAIQAAINTVSAKGGTIFFPPGTYRIDGQLNVSGSYNVVLAGTGPQGSDRFGPWNTTLLFTKSGNLACINARSSQGFTVDRLALVVNNSQYTGAIVDCGSPGDPVPTYRPTFRNGYVGGANTTAVNTYAAIWLGQVVEAVIENMVIGRTQYGLVGRSSAEPGFSNVITMIGGRFVDLGKAAILNPFANWTIINTVFEPSLTNAPAGIVCTSAYPAKGMTLLGASFWDASSPGIWIDWWGNGLNINGVYAEVNGATFCRLNGTVIGFTSSGCLINGPSSSTYLAVANNPLIVGASTGDSFTSGIADNTSSVASSFVFKGSYQPILKTKKVYAGTTYLGTTDIGSLIVADATNGLALVIPPDPAAVPGATMIVKKQDTTSNHVSVYGFELTAVNACRTFISDGSVWHTTGYVGAAGPP